MKSLLNKIFKRQPQFNYIIAEYQPAKNISLKKEAMLAEYDIDESEIKDEMAIDRIYQNS
jgi:hypothetical protein